MSSLRILMGRPLSAVLALSLVLILSARSSASGEENLLLNSDLSAGTSMPDHWKPSRRVGCESFEWSHSPGAPGELRISDAPGKDAAWTQKISVSPGWYHLSADLRAEDAGHTGGAYLAIISGAVAALVPWHPASWERDGLYFRAGADNNPIEVRCGLISPTHRTKAFFRDIKLTKASGAHPAGAQQFDLDKKSHLPRSSGQAVVRWTTISLVILLGTLGFIYYRFADGADIPSRPLRESSALSTSVPHDARRTAGVALIFGLLLVVILAVPRVEWLPGAGLSMVKPAATMSDEPFYILLINSLLFDHDFELQADYQRIARGGSDAGAGFRGRELDHHTILVNQRTGRHALASSNARGSAIPCDPEFTPSDDVYEVSAHPPGFSILVALAILPLRPAIGDVEGDAAIVLALISWLGALTTYLVGRKVGMGRAQAMMATLLLVSASSWLAYSRSFFPDSTIGLALILALWALIADLPILAGLGTAAAAMLKPPFAVVGVGFIINEICQGRRRNAAKLGLVLASCGLTMLAFNYWMARTPVISGSEGWFFASGLQQFYDTFLHPSHGLFFFVPWTVVAFIAIGRTLGGIGPNSKLLRQMAAPMALYIVVLSCFGGTPGLSYGPRYWVPFLPWLALATIEGVRGARRPALLACGFLVLLGVLVAIPGALRYPQIFSRPPWAAWKAE